MVDLIALRAANADRWAHAKLTRGPEFTPVAQRLVAAVAKARYLAVSARTGVPWFVIAVIHQRECKQSWAGSIAQGDRWDRKSTHVPAGRGPFQSWEDATVDDPRIKDVIGDILAGEIHVGPRPDVRRWQTAACVAEAVVLLEQRQDAADRPVRRDNAPLRRPRPGAARPA